MILYETIRIWFLKQKSDKDDAEINQGQTHLLQLTSAPSWSLCS